MAFNLLNLKLSILLLKKIYKKILKLLNLLVMLVTHSSYHHGETSLANTIIGITQKFVGSNNINTLSPKDQFGTRLKGGKDHASPKYIFTHLNIITRLIFIDYDDNLLSYLDDDGYTIEPEFYVLIISLIFINGSEGIGTGFSTSIPQYNPIDIINTIKKRIKLKNKSLGNNFDLVP
jgi:DNA topoisomerase-2